MNTALITGASRGIGRAAAVLFARRGWNVVVNYKSSGPAAAQLAEEINKAGAGRALAVQADIADEAQVRGLFRQAAEAFPAIDVLVNNAGIACEKLLTDMTAAEWDELFAVNVRGMFLCTREALPGMIGRKRGRIVNVSSIWGMTGASCEAAYSASKAAVIGFTKALAKEVGPSGITVNCVAPGVVDTDMNAGLTAAERAALEEATPLGRTGGAEEIARAVWFLASGEADFITGQVLSPNGGFVV